MYLGGDVFLWHVVGLLLRSAVHLGQEVIACQAQEIYHHQDREQDPAKKNLFVIKTIEIGLHKENKQS